MTQFVYNEYGDLITTIDPRGNQRTISHDENGNATGTSFTWTNPDDPNDVRTVTTTNVFDAGDQNTQNSSSSGATSTLYDALGQAWKTVDADGLANETTFDTRGLSIQTRSESRDEAGNTIWLESRTVYDAAGRAIYASDPHPEGTPAAQVTGTRTVYDADGRVVRTEQLLGLDIAISGTGNDQTSQLVSAGTVVSSTTTTYGPDDRVTQTTDSFGRITQTLYDDYGRTIETRSQTQDENGTDLWLVSRTVYDSLGRVVLSTSQFTVSAGTGQGQGSAPVRATRSLYDSAGRVYRTEQLKDVIVEIQNGVSVITGEGTVVSSTQTIFDTEGRTRRTIAADGRITDLEYNDLGNQSATIGHPVPAEEVGWGALYPGKLVRHRSETEYDQYGWRSREWSNIAQVEEADGTLVAIDRTQARKTDFRYDEHGNLVQTIRHDGSYTLTRYDSRGRVVAEMQPVDASVSAVWSDPDNSYIVSGSSPVQTIPTKLFEYDLQGRLSAVELPAVPDPDNGNTLTKPRYEYGYNEQGNQTLIKDPLGRETRFTFDSQGRQLTRTLPLSQVEQFQYNDRGRQTLYVSFEGIVTESIYDDATGGSGRLIEKRFFDNLTQYDGGSGTPSEIVRYSLDEFGRTVQIIQDADGNLSTTADQRVTDKVYDDVGRVVSVASPEGTIHYEYDEATGRLTRTYTGNEDTTGVPHFAAHAARQRQRRYRAKPRVGLQSVSGGAQP